MFESNTPVNALTFTDHQMMALARARGAAGTFSAFLQDVARRLHGVVELGDGAVAQAAREAQAEIRKAAPPGARSRARR